MLLLRWPDAIGRKRIFKRPIDDRNRYILGILAEGIGAWHGREVESERYPPRKIVGSRRYKARYADDVIGSLVHDIQAIQEPGHAVHNDDGRIVRGILRRMGEDAQFAPVRSKLNAHCSLLREKLINLRVVGLPRTVLRAGEPIADLFPRTLVIEAKVHEEIPCLDCRPVQGLEAVEGVEVNDPRHAVRDRSRAEAKLQAGCKL